MVIDLRVPQTMQLFLNDFSLTTLLPLPPLPPTIHSLSSSFPSLYSSTLYPPLLPSRASSLHSPFVLIVLILLPNHFHNYLLPPLVFLVLVFLHPRLLLPPFVLLHPLRPSPSSSSPPFPSSSLVLVRPLLPSLLLLYPRRPLPLLLLLLLLVFPTPDLFSIVLFPPRSARPAY